MTQAIIAGTQERTATGFQPDNIRSFEKSKVFRDLSSVWVVPLRDTNVDIRILGPWMTMHWPENTSRSGLVPEIGKEVGAAYETLFERCTSMNAAVAYGGPEWGPRIVNSAFIVTSEADNILPVSAFKTLLAAIHECPDCGGEVGQRGAAGGAWVCADGHRGFDALSGLYFMKTDPQIPMAYGDPAIPGDMRPRSIERAIAGKEIIEVNGIAMGCAVWRKELFAHVSRPWFETTPYNTQDIYFCKKAKAEAGARFGVHCGVQVGHLDFASGRVY